MEKGGSFQADLPDSIQPEPSGSGLLRGFLSTAKAVLLSPRRFFPSMPVEGGLLGPYVFFLFCTTFSFVVSICLTLATSGSISPWILLVMFVAIWMPFVSAGILNFLFTKLLRTGGSYEATFRVVCYASAVNLFAWFPVFFVILLFQFYEIYLSALGLSIVHRVSVGQALLVVIGGLLAISVIVTLAARLFFPF
ncbi:MAG: YIP1 family protein [Deltaproteobacteria bacterium]|nr:MAG: YIP1 family protein [Deltaproteobacteria bacterium]